MVSDGCQGWFQCWSCTHLQCHSVHIEKLSYSYNFSYMCLSNYIFLQSFDDGASVLTKCSVERLKTILNPDETRTNSWSSTATRMPFISFVMKAKVTTRSWLSPSRRSPVICLAWFCSKKQSYKARMTTTSQKMIWEVSYCVRRVDKTSLCLGDILLSCAIEEVRNRAEPDTHRASTFIWLVLAGGFSNLPALRVYLLHGFEVIGFHKVENEVLMAVCNVGDDNTRRALKQVTGKLKSTFLLPVLKKAATIQAQITCMAPTCMAPNVWHQM